MLVSSLVTSSWVKTTVRSFAPVSVSSRITSTVLPLLTNKSLPRSRSDFFKSSTHSSTNFARPALKRSVPRFVVWKKVLSNTYTGTTSAVLPDRLKSSAARVTTALSNSLKSFLNQMMMRVRPGDAAGADVSLVIERAISLTPRAPRPR